MGKTIDTLDGVVSKKQSSPHRADIQAEIAKTYFHTPVRNSTKKKPAWKSILPWFVAILAIIIAAAILLFKSSIDVKVRILGEIPSVQAGAALNKGLPLVVSGEPNPDMIKDAYFAGDAKSLSVANPEEIVLSNSRGEGWANYTIELKDPVDLNKLDLQYAAKGAAGDEFLTLVIVDSVNRVYRLEKDLSSRLDKGWRIYTMNFAHVNNAVDLSNIAKIRFEFGSLTAGNYPNAVLFLKDIYVAKTRRLKWL